MNLKAIARQLSKSGRYGDKHLLHVSDDELRAVIASRGLTLNPHTGLPEAWNPFSGDFSIHGHSLGNFGKSIRSRIGAGVKKFGKAAAKATFIPAAVQVGGLSGGNIAKNILSGDRPFKHAAGAAALDVAGLGAGFGASAALGAGSATGAAATEGGLAAGEGATAEGGLGGLVEEPGLAEGAAPSEISGYDPTLISEPSGTVSQEAANAAGVGSSGGGGGGAGNAIARYGPLALGAAGLASNYAAGKRSQQQIAGVGAAQRAEGEKLLKQYDSGQLTIADAHNIEAYEASATAIAKQYFAKSGQSSSTAANSTLAQIQGNVAAMKSQALQNYLKLGTSMLNVTDQYQLAAIEQGIKNDQQMWNMIMGFGSTYGQWNRSLNTMTE
jgi:hypothetical protein